MPRYCSNKPRALRPNQILPKWQKIQQNDQLVEEATLEKTQKLSSDPVVFCKEILGFKPFAYQEQFIQLFKENQFTAARWSRQSGKSFIVAALLLWYAVTNSNSAIGIVGPSWRQTKRILQRIATFTRKLPAGIVFKPQRTQIHLTNGSIIEAFPNNPETIRGPTLHIVYCLPSNVKVALPDCKEIPICELKTGQEILSYNIRTGQ